MLMCYQISSSTAGNTKHQHGHSLNVPSANAPHCMSSTAGFDIEVWFARLCCLHVMLCQQNGQCMAALLLLSLCMGLP